MIFSCQFCSFCFAHGFKIRVAFILKINAFIQVYRSIHLIHFGKWSMWRTTFILSKYSGESRIERLMVFTIKPRRVFFSRKLRWNRLGWLIIRIIFTCILLFFLLTFEIFWIFVFLYRRYYSLNKELHWFLIFTQLFVACQRKSTCLIIKWEIGCKY